LSIDRETQRGNELLNGNEKAHLAAVPTVDAIARDVAQVVGLPRETLVALLLKCAAVQAAVSAELVRTAAADPTSSSPMSTSPRYMTAKQMAEHLQVKESWIASEARAGRIPKEKVGRYVRFDPLAVERALAQRVE
jgi:excisionase family DNA binding protein